MDETNLFSALSKMGFGDTLSECTVALKFAYLLDPINVKCALEAFSLSDEEISAVNNFTDTI
jgi:hypothetical protein